MAYTEEETLMYEDLEGEEDEAFFNPLQAYDDMAELVVRGVSRVHIA